MPNHIKDGITAFVMFAGGMVLVAFVPERLNNVVLLVTLFACWITASGLYRT